MTAPGPILLLSKQLSENFDEEMIIFCRDAGSAVYVVFMGLQYTSSTSPVKTAIPALAMLDVCDALVIYFLSEKKSCGGRRQK